MKLLLTWLIVSLALLIAAYLLPGIIVSGFVAALVTAIVLGLVNAIIKPIALLLTLPLNIVTLGLFTFVINALLLLLVSAIVPGFNIINFWWALLLSLILSVVNFVLNRLK